MKLTIKNNAELDAWLNVRRLSGAPVYSIKGDAPKGATYEDGSLIVHQVNVAFMDMTSGEEFNIIYETT